ncbi:MAG: sensor domain-containing diguanylate cyclase [Athalassotoga sp.]|uniref:sensor domain-containing diguanylate cyclase n=1 Tax=Athalassotoga sp. TaxID=2022597 RepID=UPI003D08B48B
MIGKSPVKVRYILGLIIITAIVILIAYFRYSSIRTDAIDTVKDQSMLLSIGMDEFMGYYKTAGTAFNNKILQSPDLLENSSNLNYILSNFTINLAPDIKSVEVLNPDGLLIGATQNAPKVKLSDLYFGQKSLGLGTVSTDTPRLLPVGYRITESGKVVAILVMDVDLESLLEKWAQSTHLINQNGLSLCVIRSDGMPLWASKNSYDFKPIDKHLNAGYVKLDDKYSWIEPVSSIEGFSVAQISQSSVMALWYKNMIYILLVWIFVVIIIYLFYKLSVRYEKRIQTLSSDQQAQIKALTEQKSRFEILKRMYDSIMLVENTMLNVKNEEVLLQSVCDRMTETGLFDFVGIAIPNDKKVLRYKFLSGNAKEIVLKAQSQLPDDIQVLEMDFKDQKTYVGSRQSILNSTLTPDVKSLMNEIYETQGWKSSISIPIFRNGIFYGVIDALSKIENFFEDDVKALAEIFARLLGDALENIDARSEILSKLYESQYLATHDALTGLLNRTGIMDRIEDVIARAKREKKYMAVGMIDIDDFKLVNDTYGHAAGDYLLIQFGQRIKSLLRGEDFIGRIGGDEFVMVIMVKAEEDIDILMKRFEQSLTEPFKVGGEKANIKISAGFTLYPKDNNSFDVLLRHADKIMYLKKDTKNEREKFWGIYEVSEQQYKT